MRFATCVLAFCLVACGQPKRAVATRTALPTSRAENETIGIVITQAESHPFARLRVRLVNLSQSPLSLPPDSLPWGNPYAMELGVTNARGVVLPLSLPIFDPLFAEPVRVEPGATVEGTLDLSWRVEGIAEALAQGPVRIAWAYPSAQPGFVPPSGLGKQLTGTIVLAPAALNPGAG